MQLTYNGVTLPSDITEYLIKVAGELKVPPSYLIVKLHFEGVWGQSEVARLNNNWSGMSMPSNEEKLTSVTRPSGVVVTKGTARPEDEGGYYYKYASLTDFMTDWTYLIRRGGIYKVADNSTFEGAIKGMFKVGGATYDYAALGYEKYLERMVARRKNINQANDGALDLIDKGVVDMAVTANQVLDIYRSYLGVDKYSAKHSQMVADYNKVTPRPVGYALKSSDDYCDAGFTVVFDKAGASDLVGRECGVERHKSIFKQKNIWLGLARPQVGDAIIFRWDGNRNGFAHHIGIVEKVSGDTITTIEFNTVVNGTSTVARRTYKWNTSVIQGYARPKYGNATVTEEAKESKKVNQHIVVTIENLRAFNQPSSSATIVENIKKDYVKNIDMTIEAEGYIWGGWISSADGKRRYTTLQTSDGKRKFADIKDGTIGHGGKTYTEWLKLQEKDEQPIGGDEPKLADNEVLLDGKVYVIKEK